MTRIFVVQGHLAARSPQSELSSLDMYPQCGGLAGVEEALYLIDINCIFGG